MLGERYLFICFFNLQFLFIHDDKPKNTNSVVIYKHRIFTRVYHNTTISLV